MPARLGTTFRLQLDIQLIALQGKQLGGKNHLTLIRYEHNYIYSALATIFED